MQTCLIVLLLVFALPFSQAPPAIQIFMPGGTLPPRPIRFTLTRDDGRIETVFTDTKGKFQVTGDLIRDADYVITVETDGATYDTTVATFRIVRGTPVYTPVFLRPFRENRSQLRVLLMPWRRMSIRMLWLHTKPV